MLTAITPTGDRPLAFSLCQKWMENQAVKVDQWLVVDDGRHPIEKPNGFDYVRREPGPGDSKYTLSENLRAAIPYIKGDMILIIEDDEYYAPGYVGAMATHLSKTEVTGIGRSRYYHLPTGGYLVIGNMGHASLAQTGFRKSFIPELLKILTPGKLYIDYAIWQAAKKRRSCHVFYDPKPLYVGMKGLPGRGGIGRGHDPRIYKKRDAGRKVLRQWVPKDYQVYLNLLGKKDA
jgi:hypothetical protein